MCKIVWCCENYVFFCSQKVHIKEIPELLFKKSIVVGRAEGVCALKALHSQRIRKKCTHTHTNARSLHPFSFLFCYPLEVILIIIFVNARHDTRVSIDQVLGMGLDLG